MNNGVFLINKEDNTLIEMQSALYETEDVLQSMIARFPRLLSSSFKDPQNSEWLLISREVGVPDNENGSARWSLDHLFIDGEGIPVLVEVKRSTDTRIRREVVGQMMDYAANAVTYWPLEHIQSSYIAECKRLGLIPQDNLESFLNGRMDEESFWIAVKTNLQAGRIRMIFVADYIPHDLKRIIEFLNMQMDPAEVLGIEVKQFTDGTLCTITPVVVGQTSIAEARKQTMSASQRQTREGLQETVDIFNHLAAGYYKATGKGVNYRQIKILDFPNSMHYEFLHTTSAGITAEFHIESEKYKSTFYLLQDFALKTPEINGGKVIFDANWYRGCGGRIRIVQTEPDPHMMASTMLEFINLTKLIIGESIARCDQCSS